MKLKLCTYVSFTLLQWAELFRKVCMEYFSSNYQNRNGSIFTTLCCNGHASVSTVKYIKVTKYKHQRYIFSQIGLEKLALYDDISFPCAMRQFFNFLVVSRNLTDIPRISLKYYILFIRGRRNYLVTKKTELLYSTFHKPISLLFSD